jgi:hypothetical protein
MANKKKKEKDIPGTPHRFPPAPENARQLSQPRTVRSREGWARFAESQGYDWVEKFRLNMEKNPTDKCFFTLSDCLGGGFSWVKSPEGYHFWREVYRETGGQINSDLVAQRMDLMDVEKMEINEGKADHLGI